MESTQKNQPLNPSETEKLIQHFQNVNKILRQRAITLGFLMIIAIGLIVSENSRIKKVMELSSSEFALRDLRDFDTTKLKNTIDSIWISDSYGETLRMYSNWDEIMYEIKTNNYKDRTPIIKALSEIEKKIEQINTDHSISLLGINIPLDALLLVSLFIMLILFHDFTQMIFYRRKLFEVLKKQQVSDLILGPELFGVYSSSVNDPENRFINIVSSLIVGALLITPLIASFMFMESGAHSINDNPFLIFLNLVCLLIIIIDTILIFHSENIFYFKVTIDFLTGNVSEIYIGIIKKFWIGFSIWLIAIYYINIHFEEISLPIKLFYISITSFSSIFFSYSLWKCYKNPESKLWKALRFIFLTLNGYWLYHGFVMIDPGYKISENRFLELMGTYLFILPIIILIIWIHLKFFSPSKRIFHTSNK